MKYLLDTNICIHFLRGCFGVDRRVLDVDPDNLAISEITRLELLYGIEKAKRKGLVFDHSAVLGFLDAIRTIPLTDAIDLVASEKARLEDCGTPIDDNDLLIGCTSIAANMILVTENEAHMSRLKGIVIQNWSTRP